MSGAAQPPRIHWTQDGAACSAVWRSAGGVPPPRRVVLADDQMPADTAYRLVCEGTALLWTGDYQNARQLLQALARRIERRQARSVMPQPPQAHAGAKAGPNTGPDPAPGAAFHWQRKLQAERTRLLGMVLLRFEPDHSLALRRAPDVRVACTQAWGPGQEPSVASLRELLGLIGAAQWREKGVEVAALGARIHPHYGVFSPVRGEYVDLVQAQPLPQALATHGVAFDIGTGTGVLAAVLARRGVRHGVRHGLRRVVATDSDPRALDCARDNLARLGLLQVVEVVQADLFPTAGPQGQPRAGLLVCNPPWLPARASSSLEHAVYDPDSRMLRGFLQGAAAHLAPGGEAWLIMSDLAEHLGLRSRAELLGMFDAAGLVVDGRSDTRPRHPRAADGTDPLHVARAAEVTSLWRLRVA